jgi:small-conductance mechanosensitive channel
VEYARLVSNLQHFAEYRLFELGSTVFTPAKLATIAALVLLLFFVTRVVERVVARRVLARVGVEAGVINTVAIVGRYVIFVSGLLVVLGSVDIDLSGLVVVFGTLGVGLGLALQPLLTNFISGLVLLFERSLKPGDRIEIDDVVGTVKQISMRSTTIVTNDNISIIVPNSQLTGSQIVNWSFTDRTVRLRVPIEVAYGSNADQVSAALMTVARRNSGVLEDPAPDVLFDGFGESALKFQLRVWTRDYDRRPGALRSELNFAILRAFRAEGIEIPFPQRDVHIRTHEVQPSPAKSPS